MNEDYRRGYRDGFLDARDRPQASLPRAVQPSATEKKVKRKPSAYNKRYSRAFKKVAPRYKTKAGKWKKDGFKKANKAAHRMAKQ